MYIIFYSTTKVVKNTFLFHIINLKVEKFTRTIPATWFDTGLIGISFMTNLKKRLIILKHGHKILISDYCKNITIICVIEFCIMAS